MTDRLIDTSPDKEIFAQLTFISNLHVKGNVDVFTAKYILDLDLNAGGQHG